MNNDHNLSKTMSIPELAEKIFSLLSIRDICSARLVCNSWNEHILPILCKKSKIVEVGTGLSNEAKNEQAKLRSLIQVVKNSSNFPIFRKFHFGHLLDYSKLNEIWKTQGSRIVELTIDCHNDPDDIPAAGHYLKFNLENLKLIFEKCSSSLEDLRICLPWDMLDSEEKLFFQDGNRYKLWKCKRLLLHNAIFHNYCETEYPPITKDFWVDFLGLFPSLTELSIEMDLNPENVDTFIPMLTAIEMSLSSTLNDLSLTVPISNDELEYFAKCNLSLKALSIKKFHCTATASKLKELLEMHKSTLESLTIHIIINYEPNDIEYENFPEPNFGKATLPSPMENLKYLELSYNDDESIHPNSVDVISSLNYYRIVCLEDFERLEDKTFLDCMLPTNGTKSHNGLAKIKNVDILLSSDSEAVENEAVVTRAKSIFPSVKIRFGKIECNYTLSYGISSK